MMYKEDKQYIMAKRGSFQERKAGLTFENRSMGSLY